MFGGGELEERADGGSANDDGDGVGGLVEGGENSKTGEHNGVGASDGSCDNGSWLHHHDGKTSDEDADDGANGKGGHVGAKLFGGNKDSEGETDAANAEFLD